MQASFDRLNEAIAEVGTACGNFAAALLDVANALIAKTGEIIAASGFDFGESARLVAAYSVAAQEHPEWVHRANYSKKKRIRKKYHDRIMREYRRVNKL